MSIKIVEDKYLCTPEPFCDVCGQRITDIGMGAFYWQHIDGQSIFDCHFIHKECWHGVDESKGRVYWDELAKFNIF